jgi:hypothetical protein
MENNMSEPDDPDLPDPARVRQSVDGYLELDLPEMAEAELTSLPLALKSHPLVLESWLALAMHRKAWVEAVQAGLTGCGAVPGQPSFFIHTAFCLHELQRTEEAHLLLLSGPSVLEREPLFHYNMGCYLTVLGRLEEAERHLKEAFRLDDSLRHFAKSDRDLQGKWPDL